MTVQELIRQLRSLPVSALGLDVMMVSGYREARDVILEPVYSSNTDDTVIGYMFVPDIAESEVVKAEKKPVHTQMRLNFDS